MSLSERLVEKTTDLFARKTTSRRSFLAKTAIVGSAVAVNPITYLLRPGTAYASLCGSGATCDSGWTAFCCSVTGGYNGCPGGSFVGGWWKADNAAFCCGAARYIIDCNAYVPVQCGCRCADYGCDQRRTCCNQFRYGQCHQEISAYGPVVCRVATCTPPWIYDGSCTADSATDNRTVDHGSPCLPDNNCTPPSAIAAYYASLGGPNGILGPPVQDEGPTPDGRGRYALYQNGGIWYSGGTGPHEVHGRIGQFYAFVGRSAGILGFPLSDETPTFDGVGRFNRFERGEIYWHPYTDAHEVHGQIADLYRFFGGPASTLGYPVSDEHDVGDGFGRTNGFQNGDIWWSPWLGPFEVTGAIANTYRFIGGPRSAFGYPLSHVTGTTTAPGQYVRFEHGVIYSTSATGVQGVQGSIFDLYVSTGDEGGVLGLPTTFEQSVRDGSGRFSLFQHGSIWASLPSGVHEVHGQADAVYRFIGGPLGPLGYPTTDTEYVGDGVGAANHFARGSIYTNLSLGTFFLDGDIAAVYRFIGGPRSPFGYPVTHIANVGDGRGRVARFQSGGLWFTPTTGAKGVWGPIAVKYDQLGGPTGSLGYPTSFVTPVGTRQQATFERGTLTYDPATGIVTVS